MFQAYMATKGNRENNMDTNLKMFMIHCETKHVNKSGCASFVTKCGSKQLNTQWVRLVLTEESNKISQMS